MQKRPSSFPEWLLAIVLMIGASIFGTIAVIWAKGTYDATVDDREDSVYLGFKANGDPYLTKFSRTEGFYASYTDLDGKPITFIRNEDYAMGAKLPAHWPLVFSDKPLSWGQRLHSFMDGQKPPNYWYLVHDGLPEGHAYFEGYSAATKDRIGFLGTAGFREERVPLAEHFFIRGGMNWYESQVSSNYSSFPSASEPRAWIQPTAPDTMKPWLVFLNGSSKVYEVDLNLHQVREVLASPKNAIRSVHIAGNAQHDWLAARSDNGVNILHPNGEEITLPLAEELRGHDLQIAQRPNGEFTVVSKLGTNFDKEMQEDRVYVAAADGTLKMLKDVETTAYLTRPSVYEAPLLLGSPTAMVISLLCVRSDELLTIGKADTWEEGVAIGFREYAAYLIATVLAGLALAMACYRRQSRYAVRSLDRILWPAFVFLFGVPGWIGYRYRRRWPVIEPCPACHEPSPRDDKACANCGREFPLPAVSGVEVFA